MSKNPTFQKFVFKIHSTRLRKSRWNLSLSIEEAMKNGELIQLADSTALRFIDEFNQITDYSERLYHLKQEIRHLQQSEVHSKKAALKKLYIQLNTLQFKEDYVCLIIDKDSDYDRAYEKGFIINNIKYSRLLATTGGVKNKTIIFTSQRLKPMLRLRMDNGRNPDIPYVPAKFSAYESLICSSSVAVSHPKIIVVNDCMTTFFEDVIKLDDSISDEPTLTYEANYKIDKNVSDGFGLMLPFRAAIWAEELGLDYLPSGMVTRPYAFGKGLLATFDFHEFAKTVAHADLITDAWGQPRNIYEADVILTTSMLKLWDAYDSFESYMENCIKNNYQFCITKTCPKDLESERTLNYQFLQSYALDDTQIEQLITPMINEIREVLGEDAMKSLLFLRGTHLNDSNVWTSAVYYIKALMIDPKMADDPYVRTSIYRLMKKIITDAKIGAIKVHGNYQIACGDPYALCQSMFGMAVTGLLKADHFYSQYWSDRNIDTAVCFRAPMTCHNNIRKLYIPAAPEQKHWYKYIKTMLVFNAWDTTADALNGEDFDGDQNFLTDNPVLLENHRQLPTIMCIQHKAEKKLISENLLVEANKNSFGDDIGKYTNGITAQFEVQAQFLLGSKAYEMLDYRIMCGQLFQQNAIDKTKGILSNPRPSHWFDYNANKSSDSDDADTAEKKEFNRTLCAYKKPYFMQYIYPQLQKAYRKYVNDSNKKCMTQFNLNLDELSLKANKSKDEKAFLKYYTAQIPIGIHPCIINKICHRFEEEFDGYIKAYKQDTSFDPQILKSPFIDEQSNIFKKTQKAIEILYKDYCAKVTQFQQQLKNERLNEDTIRQQRMILIQYFQQESELLCPDRAMLANMIINICYGKALSKQFAWDICGETFIENLLIKNNGMIHYPVLATDTPGEITYRGQSFTIKEKKLGGDLIEYHP